MTTTRVLARKNQTTFSFFFLINVAQHFSGFFSTTTLFWGTVALPWWQSRNRPKSKHTEYHTSRVCVLVLVLSCVCLMAWKKV
jgi:hypothetical protein